MKPSLLVIQNKIIHSLSETARPGSRSNWIDAGISSGYLVTLSMRKLILRKLIRLVERDDLPKTGTWYELTAEGHALAMTLTHDDAVNPEVSLAREFFSITENREGMYACRK